MIVLRMSERDWLNVVSEHNTDIETSFGDEDNLERLIETSNVNIGTLKSITMQTETEPKCLPQDLKGLRISKYE